MKQRTYISIDLKSFYASVECIERGLDPMSTNLVVADSSRTEKTICLAVSPSLKSLGIPGRPRLFEVVQNVRQANYKRRAQNRYKPFTDKSCDTKVLADHPETEIDYIVAVPRMAYYMEYSTRIYNVYLKYIAPEDIHVYSIDEVFMDVTGYLDMYKLTPRELAMKIILDVLDTTGITATAGIGTNLYLAKVAMDIVAKHIPPDENGVRIAQLDEASYRRKLWDHRPITDFWRVGKGYAKKLEECGIFTMGDVALCSVGGPADFLNQELLYKMFGVNAELLIDHAWGWEPCTIQQIKAYKPETNSICSGQVLHEPYTCDKARVVVREMLDSLVTDLLEKRLVTNQIVMTVGYDIQNLADPQIRDSFDGEIIRDSYGRRVPKHAHGTGNMYKHTSSLKQIIECGTDLYDRIINPALLVRRITVTANNVITEADAEKLAVNEQLDLFTDVGKLLADEAENNAELEKEKNLQRAILGLKKKYGKNAVLKGMNFQQGATMIDRNGQIGGHKA